MVLVAIKNAVVAAASSGKKGTEQASLLDGGVDGEDRGQVVANHESIDFNSNANSLEDELSQKFSHNSHDHEGSMTGLLGKIDPRVMSDMIIGLSDGLTVPFALTAGLSSLGDTKLVITGGFAELISGAISMGLGGYLAAKSESDYYKAEVKSEKAKFYSNMNEINHEIEDILLEINQDFSEETILSFIKDLKKNPKSMMEFLIRYGKGLEEPAENRQLTSALTIGISYFLGGFVPLIPYFFVAHVDKGLFYSIILMGFTLFWFGFVKAVISLGDQCSHSKRVMEGLQMVIVGGVAAGSAWCLVRVIE